MKFVWLKGSAPAWISGIALLIITVYVQEMVEDVNDLVRRVPVIEALQKSDRDANIQARIEFQAAVRAIESKVDRLIDRSHPNRP